jgi:hypothetical protein
MLRPLIQALTLVAIALLSHTTALADKPRLVVNIIVGSLSDSDLDRYSANFSDGGFKLLMDSGVRYHNALLDYANTSTAAGLATIATGTEPATHGIVGTHWWNYVDGSYVELIFDNKAHAVEPSTGTGKYSPHRLSSPTIGDMLVMQNRESKSCSIAVDPLSAILLTGKHGVAYWAETKQTRWTTSSAYTESLPKWVAEYNREEQNKMYHMKRWRPIYVAQHYTNSEVAVLEGITGKTTSLISDINLNLANSDYGKMCYTPAGNTMLLKFAFQYITKEGMGKDEHPDIINISLDTARYIAETYGTESMEYEDMLYRLDKDIEDFIVRLYAQFKRKEDVVITLSSYHGTSPSYNIKNSTTRERFNIGQMEVLVNAFLGAKYGSDKYILGFANKALYLNHTLLNSKRMDIPTIREEIATFLLQMRGVSSAISSTALRNTYFGAGRSRLIQQSFYPTRSGDVVIDLLPGWIFEREGIRSSSDGGYNYDRNVPLMIYRNGKKESIEREVSISALAPTLAYILGIERPWASTETALYEFR